VVIRGSEGQTLQTIKNGSVVETVTINSDPFTHVMTVDAPAEGEDRYRHKVVIGIAPQAVGSYVWFRAAEGSSGGSCRIASASDFDTSFLLGMMGLFGWGARLRHTR
jgi:hypothetical protein